MPRAEHGAMSERYGDNVLRRIAREARVPQPSYVLSTSPGKYQTVWKVESFTLSDAEALQRSMAATFGTDRAVVDAARLLRLPGFENRKYDPPHLVVAARLSSEIYRPEHFQVPTPDLSEPVMRRIRLERLLGMSRCAETPIAIPKGQAREGAKTQVGPCSSLAASTERECL